MFLQVDSEDSDQTGRMLGAWVILLVLSAHIINRHAADLNLSMKVSAQQSPPNWLAANACRYLLLGLENDMLVQSDGRQQLEISLVQEYGKNPKSSDTWKIAILILKFELSEFTIEKWVQTMHSVDPDQTASSAVWSGSTLFVQNLGRTIVAAILER